MAKTFETDEGLILPRRSEPIAGKKVAPIVLGTARFAACGERDEKNGFFLARHDQDETETELLRTAIRLGFNFIDTAEAYGDSEILVGQAIRDFERQDIVVATKVGIRPASRDAIRRSIYSSVERLGLKPDVIFVHDRWKEQMNGEMDACLAELDHAVDVGLATSIGISNFQAAEFQHAIDFVNNPIVVYQAKINLVNPRKDAKELLKICRENRISFMASASLDRGAVISKQDAFLSELTEKYDMTIAQIGIFAVLALGAFPIIQSHNAEHLKENIHSLDYGMEKEDVVKLMRYLLS